MKIETALPLLRRYLGLEMSTGEPVFHVPNGGKVSFNKDAPYDIVMEGVFNARDLEALATMMRFYQSNR